MYCTNGQNIENQVVVTSSMTSVRVEPTEKSQEIAQLQRGERLSDLGEVSTTESVMSLAGERVQSPWLKIRTPDGQHGWVLAWSVIPNQNGAEWLLEKRMECYFGHAIRIARQALAEDLKNIQTDAQMSKAWRETRDLRDTMLGLLSRRPQRMVELHLDWLDTVLPGHFYQKSRDNTSLHLLADFRFWHQKALQTMGKSDDDFFQICLEVYPPDSTEAFAPVWKFDLPDGKPLSHLGAGHHLKTVQQIDRAMQTGRLFMPFLLDIKEQLLADIFEQNQRYWLSAEKIKGELAEILANSPKCLSQRELEAISIRLKMFDAPASHGITVDLRSGGL